MSSATSFFLCVSPTKAQTSQWQAFHEEAGDWQQAENWSEGIPTLQTEAIVGNGGTALVQEAASANSLRITGWNPSRVEQSAGQFNLENQLVIDNGRFLLTGGNLSLAEVRLDVGILVPPLISPAPGVESSLFLPTMERLFIQRGGTVNISSALTITAGFYQLSDGNQR